MTALCIIPARYGSARFPGKVLADVKGKPLIWHVARQALSANRIAKVIVATDDERIAVALKEANSAAAVERTRSDHPSGTDRTAEVAGRHAADVVVNVQGDEPMIDPALIDDLVALFDKDPALCMATARVPITNAESLRDPNCVKVVTDGEGYALYFSREPIPHHRDAEEAGETPLHFKHLGIYAYRHDFLLAYAAWPPGRLERIEQLEQLRALERGVRIRVIDAARDSIGVDTPEDLEKVRKHIA